MDWLIANWYLIVAAMAVLAGAGYALWVFIKMPKEERWKKVTAWLHYAVTEAEKALGGGTGQLKLAMVYDMFISKFPFVKVIMPYATFLVLVDAALDWMRKMLAENAKMQAYVTGEITDGNVN